MARHFIVRCEDCRTDGPFLRQAVTGRVYLAGIGLVRREPEAEMLWDEFLDKHEYHDLRLRPEGP